MGNMEDVVPAVSAPLIKHRYCNVLIPRMHEIPAETTEKTAILTCVCGKIKAFNVFCCNPSFNYNHLSQKCLILYIVALV